METIENKNVPKEQTNPNEDDGEERKPDQEKCDYCGVMEQRLYRYNCSTALLMSKICQIFFLPILMSITRLGLPKIT